MQRQKIKSPEFIFTSLLQQSTNNIPCSAPPAPSIAAGPTLCGSVNVACVSAAYRLESIMIMRTLISLKLLLGRPGLGPSMGESRKIGGMNPQIRRLSYSRSHNLNNSRALIKLRKTYSTIQISNPAAALPHATASSSRSTSVFSRYFDMNLSTSEPATESEAVAAEGDEILVNIENQICRITFNRPEKKNSFNASMFKQFIKAIYKGDADENVTIIVVTGSGSHFTSGIDLSGFRKKPSSPPVGGQVDQQPKPTSSKSSVGIQLFLNSILDCKKPLIALINGPTYGFGVTFLGLFDSVYANEDKATFRTQFTEFGLPPELASTFTFPNLMGSIRTNHMLLFNNKINAREAYNFGLVSQLFPDSTFIHDTNEKLREMATLPVKSLMFTKELVRGPEIQTYRSTSEAEQKHFNPKLAAEVKKRFNEIKHARQ